MQKKTTMPGLLCTENWKKMKMVGGVGVGGEKPKLGHANGSNTDKKIQKFKVGVRKI